MCGLQSERNWYLKLKEELLKNGLKALNSESCIFFNNNNQTCFFVFSSYVDDFTTIDDNNQTCGYVENLRSKTKSKIFLGMKIKEVNSGIYLDQTEYIEKLLNKYGMSENVNQSKVQL